MHGHDDDVNRQKRNSTTTGDGAQASDPAEQLFEAIRFLEQLRPNGPWVLTAIIPDGPTITITAHTSAEIDAFIREHNGKRNIYYSVNPTRTSISKKAAKKEIAAVEYLLSDCDPLETEAPEVAKTRYLEQLNGSFEPNPRSSSIVGTAFSPCGKWRNVSSYRWMKNGKRLLRTSKPAPLHSW